LPVGHLIWGSSARYSCANSGNANNLHCMSVLLGTVVYSLLLQSTAALIISINCASEGVSKRRNKRKPQRVTAEQNLACRVDGATLAKIRADSGADVDVRATGDRCRVKITGTAAQVAAAKRLVQQACEASEAAPEPEPESESKAAAQPKPKEQDSEPEPELAPTCAEPRADPRAQVPEPVPAFVQESKHDESDGEEELVAAPARGFETVARILEAVGEKRLLPLFVAQEIDDGVLAALKPANLVDLGVAPMTCLAILGPSAGKAKKISEEILENVATHQSVLEAELAEHRAEIERLRITRDEMPEDLCCPITCELMKDPVITADGDTFERCAIEQWLSTGARTSPTTNEPLDNLTLIPNHVAKRLITSLLEG